MKLWWVALGCILTGCASHVDVPPAAPPQAVPKLSCARFEDPLNRDPYPVKGRLILNRVIPLKAELRDTHGKIVAESALETPPVVRVFVGEVDRTDLAGAMDVGRKGSFVFMRDGDHPEGHWKYDLVLEDFPVPSMLRVTILSGDESEYTIEPSCSARVAIE